MADFSNDLQRFRLPASDQEATSALDSAIEQFVDLMSVAWSLSMLRRGAPLSAAEAAARAVGRSGEVLKAVVPFLQTEDLAKLNQSLTDRLVAQAQRAEAIAFVTVLHAAFESFVFDMLRVCAHYKREQVLLTIAKRQVTLEVLRASSVRQIEDQKLGEWLAHRLQRPLIENWRILFSLAPPTEGLLELAPPYDEDWIEEFDSIRQDAVHRGGEKAIGASTAATMSRVRRMVEFVYTQVRDACGIARSTDPPDPRAVELGRAMAAIDLLLKTVEEVRASRAPSAEPGAAGEASPSSP